MSREEGEKVVKLGTSKSRSKARKRGIAPVSFQGHGEKRF